ncbi:MAG TPA: LamG domain-containing protein [Thermoanaerobaculia bacterium]|nr:LamG domain-containing protein [Thermoanaerobaculia bacterium]
MRFVRNLSCSLVAALGLAVAAQAQPFDIYLSLAGAADGYVQVPTSPALNPSSQITIELFMSRSSSPAGCRSLLGKGYLTSYWIGICSGTLRSYLAGSASLKDGGTVASGVHHIAVTYDGAFRRHYIDGELVAVFPQTGLLPANAQPLRLGADVDFANNTIQGGIWEVRLWNVARTTAQIRHNINFPITGPTPGLVALWHLADNSLDAVGGHHGGSPQGTSLFFPFCPGCGGNDCLVTPTNACFFSHRFGVSGEFTLYTAPAADGHVTAGPSGSIGRVLGSSDSSTNLWFFDSANWEILVKGVNACSFNSRWWIYSAATTDVHYRLGVFDYVTGRVHYYFNFAGEPAPAVTDSSAFPCP